MAVFNLVNSFKEDLAEKVHNLGSDQLVIALSNVAPSASNTQLSDITQIAYTNLSSRNITTSASSQTGGTYKLTLNNLVLTASGNVATFRYVVIYNDTSTNDRLIGYADYGSSISMTNGQTFTINFDAVNGLLTLA